MNHLWFILHFMIYLNTFLYKKKTFLSSPASYNAVAIMDTMTGTNWHDRCPFQSLAAEYQTVMLKTKLRFTPRWACDSVHISLENMRKGHFFQRNSNDKFQKVAKFWLSAYRVAWFSVLNDSIWQRKFHYTGIRWPFAFSFIHFSNDVSTIRLTVFSSHVHFNRDAMTKWANWLTAICRWYWWLQFWCRYFQLSALCWRAAWLRISPKRNTSKWLKSARTALHQMPTSVLFFIKFIHMNLDVLFFSIKGKLII